MQVFAHDNDRAYFVLAAILALGAVFILAFSWRDSIRYIRELVSPLRLLKRPRFRLIHLFVSIAIISLVVRLAMFWKWSNSNWLENISRLATISLGLSLVACLVWASCRDIFDRRQKRRSDVDVALPSEDAESKEQKKSRLKIRFPKTTRQTTAFKR